jgi:hypothetical protein
MNPNIVIDMLGGTVAASQFFEVTDGAVSQWRTNGIPRARALHLRAVRPDIAAAAEKDVPGEVDPAQEVS